MSTNRIDALLGRVRGTEGAEPEPEELNRVDQLVMGFRPSSLSRINAPQIPERFAAGVARGVVYPVRAFLPSTEDSSSAVERVTRNILSPDENAGVAGAVGEFVGMGLSFLPVFRGTQAVTAGIGILKGAPKMKQLIEGAASFAATEAFAGESPAEAPRRLLMGLGEGAAFEVGLMGIARGWRALRPARATPVLQPSITQEQIRTQGAELEKVAEVKAIPADILKIERWFAPQDETLEMTVAKLQELMKNDESSVNLGATIARVVKTHMPGGLILLPDMQDVRSIRAEAENMGYEVVRHVDKVGDRERYSVLLIDPRKPVLTPKDPELAKIFMGDGDPVLTEEQFVRLINEHDDLTAIGQEGLIGGKSYGKYWPEGAKTGFATRKTPRGIKVQTAPGNPKSFMTWIHEYTHYIHDNSPAGRFASLERLFQVPASVANLMRNELKQVTEEIITYRNTLLNHPEPRVRAQAEIKVKKNYYGSDDESISRLSELMFLNPAKAKELAPASTAAMAKYITANAPRLYEVMTKRNRAITDVFNELWVVRQGKKNVFNEGKARITSKQKLQFAKQGYFDGMAVFVDGKLARFVKRDGDNVTVRLMESDAEVKTVIGNVYRPTVTQVLSYEAKVTSAISKVLDGKPKWVGLTVRDWVSSMLPAEPVGGQQNLGVLNRAMVPLDNFEFGQGIRGWVKSLDVEEQKLWYMWTTKSKDLPLIQKDPLINRTKFTQNQVIAVQKIMQLRGKEGLALWDNGVLDIILVDPKATIRFGDESSIKFIRPDAARNVPAVRATEDIITHAMTIDPDDTLRAMLREEGVLEADMDYFLQKARTELKKKWDGLMDDNVKAIQTATETTLGKMGDDFSDLAPRMDFELNKLEDGSIEIRDPSNKSVIGRFGDEEEAGAYLSEVGIAEGPPLIPEPPVAAMAGGSAGPPPPQAQMNFRAPKGGRVAQFFAKFVDGHFLSATSYSALENIAKVAERHGYGPVYQKVFIPGQMAIARVETRLSAVKHDLLEGMTFSQAFRKLEGVISKIPRNRHETIVRYVEYSTKDDVARAGGFLQRDLTENEIRVAQYIESVGLHHDVPRLMTADRLVESSISSRTKLEETINTMKQMQLSPEAQELLAYFESLPKYATREEAYAALGLTKDEIKVIKIIQDSVEADKDKFSIMAVSKYAAAPRLEKGFKTGRDQFATLHKMSAAELEAAKRIDDILGVGFGQAGLEAKRQIAGYFPHLRMWAKEGWNPEGLGKWMGLPQESVEWSHDKFRTGELDVYNLDPLVTTFKYVRSLLMKQEFDPLLPEMRAVIRNAAQKDGRIARVMDAYVDELLGKPHDSFDQLEDAISRGTKAAFGKELPTGFVRQFINTISALAAGATIPFRPALIARNYFEGLQKIAPRVGFEEWVSATAYVMGKETGEKAFREAKDAFAIVPGPQAIRSVHASSEIFGPGASYVDYNLNRYLEKGFRWYQDADDFGRAVAFHAIGNRMAKHYGRYMKGQITFEKFLEDAKILTFDPTDVAIVENLIQNGGANGFAEAQKHLGWVFSRETMNRYGHANHPAGWNSIYGRLFGQFGTWPVQYKDYLAQGMARGTTKDKAEFAAIHFGTMGAIVAGGALAGLNLSSWAGFPGVFYTGGPMADITIDMIKSMNGSDLEKSLARQNLVGQIPMLGWMATGNPRSVFVPGSYMAGDYMDAANAEGFYQTVMEGAGFNVMKPGDKSSLEWLVGF